MCVCVYRCVLCVFLRSVACVFLLMLSCLHSLACFSSLQSLPYILLPAFSCLRSPAYVLHSGSQHLPYRPRGVAMVTWHFPSSPFDRRASRLDKWGEGEGKREDGRNGVEGEGRGRGEG